MNWVEKSKELPKVNQRIIVFRPRYLEKVVAGAPNLLFMIIDSRHVNNMNDITHWAYLTIPCVPIVY